MPMPIRIVTCSASSIAGIKNFGDELLTTIYHRWIEAGDPRARLSHLSLSQHGVLSRETRRDIDEASGLIFTGGGYFADGDAGPGHVVRCHVRALRNRRVYGTVFRRAQRRGLPCAVMGLEVGPLRNGPYRRAVREILSKSRVIVVRNEESRGNAQEILGVSRDIPVHLDAALTIARTDIERASANALPASGEIRPDELKIGLHIHSMDGGTDQATVLALVRKILSQAPPQRHVRLYYIHDQTKRGDHPLRSVRAERIITRAFSGTIVVPYEGPAETLQALGAMHLLVTSKLHVGVVARGLEIPVLSVGGHPKIRRFYEALGEADACGSAARFAAAGVPERLEACLGSEWRARIPLPSSVRDSAWRNRDALTYFMRTL
jgi:polysaccharide pyruvyl transferase WcaK-like protein